MLQLSRSSVLELRLATHGRAIHFGTSATCCDWSRMAAFAPEAETRGLLSVQIMLAQLSAGAFVERGPGTIAPRGRPRAPPGALELSHYRRIRGIQYFNRGSGDVTCVNSAELYRANAAECLVMASSMTDPDSRASLLEMAGKWLRLAELAEKNARTDLVYETSRSVEGP